MEQALRTRLQAALPGVSVEWAWSPQGVALPRVVLMVVSDVPLYTYTGPVAYVQKRVQIDILAATYKAAMDTETLIETALSGLRASPILGAFKSSRRDMSPDLGAGETLARISTDYMIHHT